MTQAQDHEDATFAARDRERAFVRQRRILVMDHGVQQKALADAIGCSESMLSQLVHGKARSARYARSPEVAACRKEPTRAWDTVPLRIRVPACSPIQTRTTEP